MSIIGGAVSFPSRTVVASDEIVVEMARLVDGAAAETDPRVLHHRVLSGNCADDLAALMVAATEAARR